MSGSVNTHAKCAPSDSKRWMHCTSAIGYQQESADRITGDDETIYNKEGTEAHDWAEKILLDEVKLMEIPEKFREPVGEYVQECRLLQLENEGMEPFVEAEVPLFYDKSATGTMDFAVVSEERVRVRDYKHGAGVYVDVFENPQLAIYALSFIEDLEEQGFYEFEPDTEVEIGIIQPRHREWEAGDYWVLNLHDLRVFCRQIQDAYDIIAEDMETVFSPGKDTCQWCRCKAFCEARLHYLAEGLPVPDGCETEAEFLEGMPDYSERGSEGKFKKAHPQPEERIEIYAAEYGMIPDEQLVRIFSRKKGIVAFLNDVEEYLERRLLDGNGAPGTKLVMGRKGNRAWENAAKAERLLENQGLRKSERCKIEVISVTEAERALGAKVKDTKNNPEFSPRLRKSLDALVYRSPAKKTLALATDSRPAVEDNLEGFEDLEEQQEQHDDEAQD